MDSLNIEIAALEAKIAEQQLYVDYLKSIRTIQTILATVEKVPNDYLLGHINERDKSITLYYDSTSATEDKIMKDLNGTIKQIKEHYTKTEMSWVKPLKQALKIYFQYKSK